MLGGYQRVRRRSLSTPNGAPSLRSQMVYTSHAGKGAMEDLEKDSKLGQGAFGEVFKMKDKTTGSTRVLKTVKRPKDWDDNRLKAEAELLSNLDHPHVLRIFSWYEEEGTVHIVMEHCGGGEFLEIVRLGRSRGEELSEKWTACGFRQVFAALVYCHGKGVVHKDLKSDNLLLLESTENQDGDVFILLPHIVVCDLGMAEVCSSSSFGFGGGKCKEIAGTPITMAPEVWKGNAGPKCDIWSMGVVMYQTFSNKLPFMVANEFDDFERSSQQWLALHNKGPDWSLMKCTSSALMFCRQLLSVKESSRPTAAACLKNDWIMEFGNDKVQERQQVIHSLTSWADKNPWQRAVCLKLAVDCPSTRKFSSVFSRFDEDESGVLSRAEVTQALQVIGIDKKLAKKIALDLDINGDGGCEYIEFSAACLCSLEDQFDEMLRMLFLKLDTSCDGSISGRELQNLISELTPLAHGHGLVLGDLDNNNDGSISFGEFFTYFGRPGIDYKNVNLTSALPLKEQLEAIEAAENRGKDDKNAEERSDETAASLTPLSLNPTGRKNSNTASEHSRTNSETPRTDSEPPTPLSAKAAARKRPVKKIRRAASSESSEPPTDRRHSDPAIQRQQSVESAPPEKRVLKKKTRGTSKGRKAPTKAGNDERRSSEDRILAAMMKGKKRDTETESGAEESCAETDVESAAEGRDSEPEPYYSEEPVDIPESVQPSPTAHWRRKGFEKQMSEPVTRKNIVAL